MVRPAVVVAAVAIALAAGAGARADVPPGATAVCQDGTYSFSQHRSGTCSHHGGVAAWLTPAAAPTPAPPTATTETTTAAAPIGVTNAGTTVLLLARVRSSGCSLRVLPDRRCSPGAYYDGLPSSVICDAGFRTSTIRDVPESEKHAVEAAYGLRPAAYGSSLEIDHIVSLELGGSNDIANLFPERAPGYHAKDRLENRLHDLVCSGEMSLDTAQQEIAADWRALYRRIFGVAPRVRR